MQCRAAAHWRTMPAESPKTTPNPEERSDPRALRRHVAAIADLGRKALSDTPIAELFDDACALVAAGLALECVALIETVGDELVLRAAAGWPDLDVVGVRAPRSHRTQAAYTLDSDGIVVLVDPVAETRFDVSEAMRDYGIVSGLSTPIRGRGKAFGVLAAHARALRT